MRVRVDRTLCVGNGVCEDVAPDLFAVGDNGEVRPLVGEIPEDKRGLADDAVQSCPARALLIEE